MNIGFDLELEAHIEVLDGVGDNRRRGAGRDHRGDHRDAVADQDLRLLAIAHPHARIGQQVALAGLALQVELPGAAGSRNTPGVELELRRKGNPQLLQARAQYLQHLDLEHDLGFGVVLHRDEVLGQADHIRRVADDQQVELLVDEGVLGLEHGLDHVLRLLHVGVLEVKAADDQVLVFAHLGGGGRIHQHGVLVQHLAGKLVGVEQQGDRILDQHVLDRDADAYIRTHFLVKNEIQAAALGQRVKHLAQAHIAELQADRHRVARLDLRR